MEFRQWQMLNSARPSAKKEAQQILQEKENKEKLVSKSTLKEIKGLGKVTIEKLSLAGINSIDDLKSTTKERIKGLGLSKIALVKLLEYKDTL